MSPGPSSTGQVMLRKRWAFGSLALIAIVLALGFGLSWLIGLVG